MTKNYLKLVFINRTVWYAILWFAFISICANLIPYFSNDYRYMLIQGVNNEFVDSLFDIVISQYNHYFQWGGRTVAHTIAQFMLYIGKPGHAIISGICYIIFMLFIYYNAMGIRPTLKIKFIPFFFISMGLWISLRAYGEVIFNVISSANYLFTTTLILIFILPYRLSFEKNNLENNIVYIIPMFILGILAGWCNENTSFAINFCIFLLLIYQFKNKSLINYLVAGFIGSVIGFALLVFSPGNEVRLENMQGRGFNFLNHLDEAIVIILESISIQFILLITLIYILYKIRERMLHLDRMPQYMGSMFLLSIGIVSALIMIASPNVPARSFTPYTTFSIAAILGFVKIFLDRDENILPTKVMNIIGYSFALYFILTAINTILAYRQAYIDQLGREYEIVRQLDTHQTNLVVSPFNVKNSKYVFIGDIQGDVNHWSNKILSSFYNIKSIKRKCDFEKDKLPYDFIPFQDVGYPVCK